MVLRILTKIPQWVGVIGVGLLVAYGGLIHADPTDDLSLTLAHPTGSAVYELMPESLVTEILRDRIDLLPSSHAPRLAQFLLALCREYRFDPAFILSLIQVESSFHVKAVSHVGAVGLMQVMPATARFVHRTLRKIPLGRHHRAVEQGGEIPMGVLTDPFINLSLGIAYLSYLRDYYEGFPPYYLVAAYNIGPAKLDELRMRKSFRPTKTKEYYDKIRAGVTSFRYYRRRGTIGV